MNTRQFSLLISVLIILLKMNCYAAVIPMMRRDNDLYDYNEDSEEVEDTAAAEKDYEETPENLKLAIGIKIVKLTQQDPLMKIFDFNMDSARKFAYKEWQTLLTAYVPIFYAETEESEVELSPRKPPKPGTRAAQNKSDMQEKHLAPPIARPNLKPKKEYDEDAPQLVGKALKDVRSSNGTHSGLK